MPSRNVVKEYAPDNYYHVYNRGVAKQTIFVDDCDKKQFIKILSRYLDPSDKSLKTDGISYRKFDKNLELLCYCLMGNHFHLLFYMNDDIDALHSFMQSILTAYSMYFNKRYKRVGTLFQGVYKASRITNEAYLVHISRYIHLNPRTFKTYRYSSLQQYLGNTYTEWLKPDRVLALFEGIDYLDFLEDYEGQHEMLENIKSELANN